MPKKKRKRFPKLPNGHGSIKYLDASHRNPYAVPSPTKEFTLDSVPKTPPVTWMIDIRGFTVRYGTRTANIFAGKRQN